MAVPAKPEPEKSLPRWIEESQARSVSDPTGNGPATGSTGEFETMTELQIHVAKLYGRGIPRRQIARVLVDYLGGNPDKPLEQKLSQARSKLRRWERTEKFRDLVYKYAVIDLDMEIPGILKGVSAKAKRGRVDAARLALEITGRHNPKGEAAPTQVIVAFGSVPRPERAGSESAKILPADVDGEVTDED